MGSGGGSHSTWAAEDAPFDLHIKTLMLGDSGVGKTCLLLRYAYDSFSPSFITTIGIDFKIKRLVLDGTRVKMQVWDTAGQERFRTITVSYFKGAHGIVLVYDVTDRATFDSISHWVQQIRQHADAAVDIVLVGNKCDAVAGAGSTSGAAGGGGRAVTREEGEKLAATYGVPFFETSAKENINVDEMYLRVATSSKMRLQALEPEPQHETIAMAEHTTKRRSCCC